MVIFFFLLGLVQCFIVWLLWRAGIWFGQRAETDWVDAQIEPPGGWPSCALIVPVSGQHPLMEKALRSLAEQNYPNFTVFLVTANRGDAAAPLVALLAREFPHIFHVVAGDSQKEGQKNHNHLAAIAHAGQKFDIYAFSDSTHIARPDFLRCLAGPIARGQAAFTTGYHEVEPGDQNIVTLAYTISVMFMRFMQTLPTLTQPWGGAMAMSRQAFEQYHIADLWADNVVDDCSLAAHLQKAGVRARLCAGAILKTLAWGHVLQIWRAWMERQVLFLKFCMPGQWVALGVVCVVMALPPFWSICACVLGVMGKGGGTAPFLALCWICAIAWLVGKWRGFLQSTPALSRWVWAYVCSIFMFAIVYAGTVFTHTLLWNNIIYRVGRGGTVVGMERRQ